MLSNNNPTLNHVLKKRAKDDTTTSIRFFRAYEHQPLWIAQALSIFAVLNKRAYGVA